MTTISPRTSPLVSLRISKQPLGQCLTKRQTLPTQVLSLPKVTPTDRPAVRHQVTVVSPMVTTAVITAVDRPLSNSTASLLKLLNSNMASLHSSTVGLLKVTASHHRATVSPRAILLSSTTRGHQPLKAPQRLTELLRQCHRAGFSNGTRTASAGCKYSTECLNVNTNAQQLH